MENSFHLIAYLAKIKPLRYTPAGVPVLELVLQHESWQIENGIQCKIQFELPAKILGKEAEKWQYRQDEKVQVSGFLAQKNQKTFQPLLRIQNIQEYKG